MEICKAKEIKLTCFQGTTAILNFYSTRNGGHEINFIDACRNFISVHIVFAIKCFLCKIGKKTNFHKLNAVCMKVLLCGKLTLYGQAIYLGKSAMTTATTGGPWRSTIASISISHKTLSNLIPAMSPTDRKLVLPPPIQV